MSNFADTLSSIKSGTEFPAVALAARVNVDLRPSYSPGHAFLHEALDALIRALPADIEEARAAVREMHEDLGPYADGLAEPVWLSESDRRVWSAWVDLGLYDTTTYYNPCGEDPAMTATAGIRAMLADVASSVISHLIDHLIDADNQDRKDAEQKWREDAAAAAEEAARINALQAPYYMDNHII